MSEVIKEGRHGGATIASLIARAEDCRSKATSAIEASTIAVQVENLEAAANLLLTASMLFMESADNYTQASMVDRANGVELRQEAAEMTAIAQEVDRESKSIYATTTARNTEIVEVIPNTFEETWKSADDVEVWNVPFYKGDLPGHEFHGNQYSSGMSGSAKELSDKALAMTVIQSKDHEVRTALNQAVEGHKQLALDHAIHVALHGNAGDAKEAQLHREASQAHHDAQVGAAKALTSVYTQSGTTVPPELFAEYAAKAKDASIASSQPFTATHPVDKSAVVKGDFSGHPFRGNQHSSGAEWAKRFIEETHKINPAETDLDPRNLGLLRDAHREMMLWHEGQGHEASARGDDDAHLAHTDAASYHRNAHDVVVDNQGEIETADRLRYLGDSDSDINFEAQFEAPDAVMPDRFRAEKEILDASNMALRSTGRAIGGDASLTTRKSAEIAKGDLPGHDFHGNQYAQGVGSSVATIRELTDKMKQGENLNYNEGDHQAIADAHDYMSGWHFAKEEEARDRGDREAVLAHRNAGSEHAYAAGVASRAEQNAEAWDRTSGSSDRSFDAEARMDEAPSTSEADALVLPASLDALGATEYALLTDQSTYKEVP